MATILRRNCTCVTNSLKTNALLRSDFQTLNKNLCSYQRDSFYKLFQCAHCGETGSKLPKTSRLHQNSSATVERSSLKLQNTPLLRRLSHSACIRSNSHLRNSSYIFQLHQSISPLLSKHVCTTFSSNLSAVKHFSSITDEGDGRQSSTGGNNNEGGNGGDEPPAQPPEVSPLYGALSTQQIPDIFPKVPVIAISRNPVFPRFIKMLEVCLLYCN